MKRSLLILITFFLLVFPSCIQRKQLVYLQDIDPEKTYQAGLAEYTVRPGDLLYVKFKTLDRAYQEMFELQQQLTERNLSSESGLYIEGYSVDEQGNIQIPVLGEVNVQGLRIEEIRNLLQEKLDVLFRDAMADVRLLSFRVTLLGEVSRPGVYNLFQSRVTIYDALARAGNLTDFGKREDVLILRQGEDGTRSIRADLTSAGILNSEAFYLQPNDMIIVEPVNNKVFRLNSPTISVALSALSAFLLVVNFFR